MDNREMEIQGIKALAEHAETNTHDDIAEWKTEIKLACKIALQHLNPRKRPSDQKKDIPYQEILDYLSAARGSKRKYPLTGKNIRLINAWYGDDYGLEAFKAVIDHMASLWKGTEREIYLRPSTLFGSKFDEYLMAAEGAVRSEPTRQIRPL